MNTPYLNMSKKTAGQLLKLLSLLRGGGSIAFSYTKGQKEYPEPILNLRWSFTGEWKTVQILDQIEGHEKDAFVYLLRLSQEASHNPEFNSRAKYLYMLGKDLSVHGKDQKTGINNLFKELSSSVKTEDGIIFPNLIIKKDGNENYIFYNVFYFSTEENTFKAINEKPRNSNN